MSAATLAGNRVTSGRGNLPAWGAWYADASLDGEITITGAVELVIADLTLKGTILSGGPAKGRSDYRIVAGAGGWGRTLPKRSYANDAGVKLSTVLGDAAEAVGETLDLSTVPLTRLGPAFVRPEGPAARLLEQLATGAWYVGEDGVTRLGRRPTVPFLATVTHGPVDRARGTVTLAAESIAAIVPGCVVDGLEAVDVLHEITAEGGLRSTIWGAQGAGMSRHLVAFQGIIEQLDPDRKFRGVTEYRVVTLEGERINLQPVRVSTGMPDLRRVLVRPGVPGCSGEAALGSRVLVGFADSDPGRPYVAAFEDAEGEGFIPASLTLQAGAMVGGEHVATVEATALMIYNTLASLALVTATPWIGASLQLTFAAAVNAALAAASAPAPPGLIAQNAAAAGMAAGAVAGTPIATSAPFAATIATVALKTPNVSGLFPSVGSKAVKAG